MFAVDDKKYFPGHSDEKQDLIEKLPPGLYEFEIEGGMFFQRPVFKRKEFKEGLIELKGKPFTSIRNRVRNFFSERTTEIYKDTKSLQFVGCLLYGPPGTGKTCFIETMCQELIAQRQAVILRITHVQDIDRIPMIVNLLRGNNRDILAVVIIEEIDKFIHYQRYSTAVEKQLIDLCDGHNTPDNVLLIASTNHINKIPDALKKRPSRFAIVEEIDSIPELIAKQLIDKFFPVKYREGINMEAVLYHITDKKVRIDQIKHIIMNMLINGMKVEEATELVTKEPLVGISDEEDEDDDD